MNTSDATMMLGDGWMGFGPGGTVVEKAIQAGELIADNLRALVIVGTVDVGQQAGASPSGTWRLRADGRTHLNPSTQENS